MEILKNPTLIWFVVGLVMFLLEMAGPGLIILFFGVGAWFVMLLTLFITMPINAQLAIFLIASVISLVVFRRMLKEAFHGHAADEQDLEKEMDDFIGHKVTVVEKISPSSGGKVELNGCRWEAVADEEIGEGEVVEIVAKENLTLKVEKL